MSNSPKPLITIVGAGALGSHLVQLLRNEEALLRVIDFDRVEFKNTAAQFHSRAAVGKLKVEALKQLMQFLFSLKIETISSKLVEDNVDQLLRGSTLVVDCLDNGPSRRVVQGFVRKAKIPCLHGGLAPGGEYARVIWDEDFVIDDVDSGQAATCEDGHFLPFISNVASYLAQAVQEFLRDGERVAYALSPSNVLFI